MFLASLAVEGEGGRVKFQIAGTVNIYSILIVNTRNRLYQLGALNRGYLTYGRNCLTQSNWRILIPISSHSLSSWPHSCSYFIYVKSWNMLMCFKFQPCTALFRPFVFILFWLLKIRKGWFCHFLSIDVNSGRAPREFLTTVPSTLMREKWFLGNVSLSSSVSFFVRNLQAFCLRTNDPEYLHK